MSSEEIKSQILEWVAQRIATHEEFHLPLRKLHRELSGSVTFPLPPIAELKAWIEADERFDLFDVPENIGGYAAEAEPEMEKLGYFRGPRVGLKSRRPTPEQVMQIIEEHTSRMLDSLQKAYDTRPRDLENAGKLEDQLLELMQRAKRIKQEIPKIFDKKNASGLKNRDPQKNREK